MAVTEITEFRCGGYLVRVSGSSLELIQLMGVIPHDTKLCSLDRKQARDLSKALSLAADIVRSKRK